MRQGKLCNLGTVIISVFVPLSRYRNAVHCGDALHPASALYVEIGKLHERSMEGIALILQAGKDFGLTVRPLKVGSAIFEGFVFPDDLKEKLYLLVSGWAMFDH